MRKEKNSNLSIKIIKSVYDVYTPTDYLINKWASIALNNSKDCFVTIKLASKSEIRLLNKKYFNKNKSCNVLSFPCNENISTGEFILGDIVICPDIVDEESRFYGLKKKNRWAHMIIHSMLHLQGFTHKSKQKQIIMEKKEKELMYTLGFSDPYYAN
ncbi:MAG: rRNA maturation RNase YbeY [Gammaproteobacteria bacterium]|nr:rRNA maturation RNase YbeY [Gammaproteobacteria bacterium]